MNLKLLHALHLTFVTKTTIRGQKFTLVLHRKNVRRYSAWVLEPPGCISQGDSKQQTVTNIKEAIEGYLQARQIMMKKEVKGAEPIEITL